MMLSFLSLTSAPPTSTAGRNDEKGVMSLLFHGPVAPRHISFGIEDSNEGVAKEIAIAEGSLNISRVQRAVDMTTLENTLNRLQENEQNQLDAVQESMFLQNAQIDELQRFISRPPRNTTAVSKHVNN
ncbi:hypothetical protein BBBOND_0404730 [Babesia bigemina]|uniref:Uncharacterized protein n=1 Tax=Babesia bigemina TaxID=5866 RepID=A0A061DCT3_BABBI|nr:hypothetical protein BBBOND_0404730 [Babesia bigemina]CDR97987.1 hypothetical protein BBBOND_0404730 [Babesia bigemina]|eukprot:XP_012770173.1 hypothetical protein BBBOND_0404730 [Babesia bigemina]